MWVASSRIPRSAQVPSEGSCLVATCWMNEDALEIPSKRKFWFWKRSSSPIYVWNEKRFPLQQFSIHWAYCVLARQVHGPRHLVQTLAKLNAFNSCAMRRHWAPPTWSRERQRWSTHPSSVQAWVIEITWLWQIEKRSGNWSCNGQYSQKRVAIP
jgi:hypothetical protein